MRVARLAFAGLLLALGACGTPDNLVVLLDDPASAKGKGIEVQTKSGSRVIDTSGEAVDLEAHDIAKAEPVKLEQKDVNAIFGSALAAVPQKPHHYVLYFKFDGADLTQESEAELPLILNDVKSRKSPDVSVVGHTDTSGAEDYNYMLGLERAKQIRDRIVAEGVDAKLVEIESHGKHNPLVPTPDNTPEARNRRVEVVVR
jgi:outer membrane protein OmpA-like peptidoglycan-associated protein